MKQNRNSLSQSNQSSSLWNVTTSTMTSQQYTLWVLLDIVLMIATVFAANFILPMPSSTFWLLIFLQLAFLVGVSISYGIRHDQPVRASHGNPAFKEPEASQREEGEPDIRPAKLPTAIPSAYASILVQAEDLAWKMKKKQPDFIELLNQDFSDQPGQLPYYQDVMANALQILENNASKIQQAIRVFGSESPVSQDRIDILNGYLNNSQEIYSKMNNILLALLNHQQASDMVHHQAFFKVMEDLAQTTKQYR